MPETCFVAEINKGRRLETPTAEDMARVLDNHSIRLPLTRRPNWLFFDDANGNLVKLEQGPPGSLFLTRGLEDSEVQPIFDALKKISMSQSGHYVPHAARHMHFSETIFDTLCDQIKEQGKLFFEKWKAGNVCASQHLDNMAVPLMRLVDEAKRLDKLAIHRYPIPTEKT